jgi:hypothetical protein
LDVQPAKADSLFFFERQLSLDLLELGVGVRAV